MNALLLLLWLAGLPQIAIASANLFRPWKLKYQENLELVAPIITAAAIFLTVPYGTAAFLPRA
jgi:hypothetical protein